jgi:UDP-N-acetylmuramate dehydrogenase
VTLTIREGVLLAPFTTLGLGGPARWFAECAGEAEIREALAWAREHGVPVHVLAGGSNTIVPDAGVDGLVLRVATRGVTYQETERDVTITAQAGEDWDALVAHAVERGWCGIECLSGIPGTVGATPIQNVGAYGQEIADVLELVTCLDRTTMERAVFPRAACGFGYRTSRFKAAETGRWIVLDVTLRLAKDERPVLRYGELRDAVGGEAGLAALDADHAVQKVRTAVLALRRRKGMVIDPADPETRSVGSFFMNPVLSRAAFAELERRWASGGGDGAVPSHPAGDGVKIPAAWLVERAGFTRGTGRGRARVSRKHTLALVNDGGTTGELLALADEVTAAVEARFGVRLEREPVVIR